MDKIPCIASLTMLVVIIVIGFVNSWATETIIIRSVICMTVISLVSKLLIRLIISLERVR